MDKSTVKKEVSWLGARLREPSSYAGAAALLAVFGVGLDPGLAKSLALIGTGLGGVLAFFFPETK